MQPLITRTKRDYDFRTKTYRQKITSYKCQDCGSSWKRFGTPKHNAGCVRQLRHELDHKTTKNYLKRKPTKAEADVLREARAFVTKTLGDHPRVRVVSVQMCNTKNSNGWHVDATRKDDGSVEFKQSRSISQEWAKLQGYVDAQRW